MKTVKEIRTLVLDLLKNKSEYLGVDSDNIEPTAKLESVVPPFIGVQVVRDGLIAQRADTREASVIIWGLIAGNPSTLETTDEVNNLLDKISKVIFDNAHKFNGVKKPYYDPVQGDESNRAFGAFVFFTDYKIDE